MDKKLLYKYINGQTSEQEEKTIVDWLDANPNNQKELNALWSMQDAIIANAPYLHHNRLHLPTRRPKWYRQRFIRICTQAAAVLLLVAGSWYASRTVIIEDTAKQYLSVAAPAGQRIDITLQDGTSVCLNSGAKLEYPIRFNRNRRVKLSGEAMFNVEHDAAHPFIVETFACDVEVLGTEFNVRAYPSLPSATTLVKGSVMIRDADQNIQLKPGEQVIKELDGKGMVKREVDVTPYIAWKQGYFLFENERLEIILNELARWYNVNVFFENLSVRDERFSVDTRRHENFEEVLRLIEQTRAVQIEVKGNNVFVK